MYRDRLRGALSTQKSGNILMKDDANEENEVNAFALIQLLATTRVLLVHY